MRTSSDGEPGLGGRLVVDLSNGIAGAYCTKLLADGGVEVVKVEAPEGDALRRWSASGVSIPAGEDGPLFSFLSSSKRSIVVEPDDDDALTAVDALLDGADAVVWSAGSRLADVAAISPAAMLRDHPHLTVTAISPFGLEGPWSGRAATEFTLQAWSGGIVGLGRGSAERAPVFVGGQVGEWLTGAYAAIGTLTAAGGLVDVSMLETLVLCLTYYPVTFAEMVGRPFRSGRSLITPGVETTSDGLVGVGVGTGQQWLDFCVMVDHPEWMEDRTLFANRGHLAPEIAEWMARHTTAEVLDLATAMRIPHAPVGNGATVPTTDHMVVRRSLRENPRDGFLEPDQPYRFDRPVMRAPEAAPTLGQHDAATVVASPRPGRSDEGAEGADGVLPFEGLRILDLTAFWAGPLCTHTLAMLGADVIHLESTARPDGTRLLAGLRFSEPDWWDRSGIFSGLNTNKKSVTLDLTQERGRELLRDLIATCDVVVENYTPRVLEQIGLDLEALRERHPGLIVVRMPGFGLDGPWRDEPAFAFVIEDAAGLTWLTGHPDANPVSPYCVGDSSAGTHAVLGLLLALEHRRTTGEGVLVEASMLDAALNVAAEQIVEHSAHGVVLERAGNRGPTAAPQGLYLSGETDDDGGRDRWVAIAVETDEQWSGLVDAIGSPEWATDPALASVGGRRGAHDMIDAGLSAWCADRTAAEVVAVLWPAGVPVAEVMQPHEQATLPQLEARGFFEVVEHPVAGAARHSTLPMRFSAGPGRFHRRPAPGLGDHNEEELSALGLSAEEIAALEAEGVIGNTPDAARRAQEKARAKQGEG